VWKRFRLADAPSAARVKDQRGLGLALQRLGNRLVRARQLNEMQSVRKRANHHHAHAALGRNLYAQHLCTCTKPTHLVHEQVQVLSKRQGSAGEAAAFAVAVVLVCHNRGNSRGMTTGVGRRRRQCMHPMRRLDRLELYTHIFPQ
jgi:hypothetical protein